MFSAVNLDTYGTSFMSDPSDFLGTTGDFLAFDDDFSPSALEPYDQLASEADMSFFDDLFSLDGAPGAKRGAQKTDPNADGPSSSNVSSEGSESASFTAPGEEDVGLPNRGGSPSFSEQSCASVAATGAATAALSDDSPVALPTLPATVESGSAMTQQYVLVRLDNNGNVLRPANEEDVQLLTQMFASDAPQPLLEELALKNAGQLPATAHTGASAPPSGTSSGKSKGKGTSRNGSGTAGQRKPGGPCHHCGATESPQWRRGPVTKPVLCNACGTRYRRTNQLGVATPSCSKDKARAGVVRKRTASAPLEREGAKAVKV